MQRKLTLIIVQNLVAILPDSGRDGLGQKERTKPEPLRAIVESSLKLKRPKTVTELYSIIQAKGFHESKESFVQVLKRLREENVISLELPPPQIESFTSYLSLLERNLWFYAVAALTAVTLLCVYVIPNTFPLVALRWITGSVFVLFLPGFTSVQALFPSGKELDDIERFALSIVLSLAITPLIGLLLNYTPWGIRLNPIVASLCLFTLLAGLFGVYRKYEEERRRLKR